MKKNKVKKEKISLKQRMFNKMFDKVAPYVQNKVDEHDNWLIDKICSYIEYLALDVNNNYDLNDILIKVKNKEYLDYDKEKCNESN